MKNWSENFSHASSGLCRAFFRRGGTYHLNQEVRNYLEIAKKTVTLPVCAKAAAIILRPPNHERINVRSTKKLRSRDQNLRICIFYCFS